MFELLDNELLIRDDAFDHIADRPKPMIFILGLGGLAAFLLGTAMLFKVEAPGFRLSPTVVGLPAVLVFALVVFVGRALWRARRRPPRVGAQAMHGLPAEILDWRAGAGHVRAMANAGRPAATKPSPPARRSRSRPSMASL